jgi:hypothetical protein
MKAEIRIEDILGVIVTKGQAGPIDLFSEDDRTELSELQTKKLSDQGPNRMRPYTPSDPGNPWRDLYVQSCTRRFLHEVVLPDWTKNHPHPNCSGIRVDDWGRLLCKYINPVNGVAGPWENPTNFVFYAYNTYGSYLHYGITLSAFLKDFCNIILP